MVILVLRHVIIVAKTVKLVTIVLFAQGVLQEVS